MDLEEECQNDTKETSFVEEINEEQKKIEKSRKDHSSVEDDSPADYDDDEQCNEECNSDEEVEKNNIKNKRGKYKMKPVPRKNKREEEKRYFCNECDCSYVRAIALDRHVKKKHQGGLECKFCSNVYLDEEKYKLHMQKEEAKPRPNVTFYCELCGYTTKFKSALRHHFKKNQ